MLPLCFNHAASLFCCWPPSSTQELMDSSRFLLVALGTREGMLVEELLHLVGLLRAAEALRAIEEDAYAAQSAARLLHDLVKVLPHEVPRRVLAGGIAHQVDQNVEVLAANVRRQGGFERLFDQGLLREFRQAVEEAVVLLRRLRLLQLRLVLLVEFGSP